MTLQSTLLTPLTSHPPSFHITLAMYIFSLLPGISFLSPPPQITPKIVCLGNLICSLKTQFTYYLFWEVFLHANGKKGVLTFVPHTIYSCINIIKLWAQSGHVPYMWYTSICLFKKHFWKRTKYLCLQGAHQRMKGKA